MAAQELLEMTTEDKIKELIESKKNLVVKYTHS